MGDQKSLFSNLHHTLLDTYIVAADTHNAASATILIVGRATDIDVIAAHIILRSVVVPDDAARVAADGLTEVGVIVRCRVGGAGPHCGTTCWIANQVVIVHFLYVVGDVNVVLVLATRTASLLLLDVGGHAPEFHVDVLSQIVRWWYRSLILSALCQCQTSVLSHELVHVCSLNDLLAPLPIDGLLVVLVLPMVNLAHEATII